MLEKSVDKPVKICCRDQKECRVDIHTLLYRTISRAGRCPRISSTISSAKSEKSRAMVDDAEGGGQSERIMCPSSVVVVEAALKVGFARLTLMHDESSASTCEQVRTLELIPSGVQTRSGVQIQGILVEWLATVFTQYLDLNVAPYRGCMGSNARHKILS